MRILILLGTVIGGAISLNQPAHADHKWVDVRFDVPGLALQLVHNDRPFVVVDHSYVLPGRHVENEYEVEYDDWEYLEDYDDDSDSDSDYDDDSDSDSDSDSDHHKGRRSYRRR